MDNDYGPLNYSILTNKNKDMSKKLIEFCKKIENYTFNILKNNINDMKKIANLLLKKETIDYDDINGLLDKKLENSINSNKLIL